MDSKERQRKMKQRLQFSDSSSDDAGLKQEESKEDERIELSVADMHKLNQQIASKQES
jgi:hypothetical protein